MLAKESINSKLQFSLLESQDQPLSEIKLKSLLEQMIKFLEKFIMSQEEANFIENKLHDYENTLDLIQIIESIFHYLREKIQKAFTNFDTNSAKYNELTQLSQEQQTQISQLMQVLFSKSFNFNKKEIEELESMNEKNFIESQEIQTNFNKQLETCKNQIDELINDNAFLSNQNQDLAQSIEELQEALFKQFQSKQQDQHLIQQKYSTQQLKPLQNETNKYSHNLLNNFNLDYKNCYVSQKQKLQSSDRTNQSAQTRRKKVSIVLSNYESNYESIDKTDDQMQNKQMENQIHNKQIEIQQQSQKIKQNKRPDLYLKLFEKKESLPQKILAETYRKQSTSEVNQGLYPAQTERKVSKGKITQIGALKNNFISSQQSFRKNSMTFKLGQNKNVPFETSQLEEYSSRRNTIHLEMQQQNGKSQKTSSMNKFQRNCNKAGNNNNQEQQYCQVMKNITNNPPFMHPTKSHTKHNYLNNKENNFDFNN